MDKLGRKDGEAKSIYRIPPYYYLHVLDQNTNVTKVRYSCMTIISTCIVYKIVYLNVNVYHCVFSFLFLYMCSCWGFCFSFNFTKYFLFFQIFLSLSLYLSLFLLLPHSFLSLKGRTGSTNFYSSRQWKGHHWARENDRSTSPSLLHHREPRRPWWGLKTNSRHQRTG